ncbi:MAG: 16S rRNA (guanine(966)-N(2))-methyltransferase RsmD [Lachnospiraceae bacterium]|nr:16S rRNA (guanine(966)-N(2))-methyltransferase RsmD [Lachnospiraceae bacterium]
MRVIAGSRRHLILKTVPGMAVRPTQDRTKETLFNILNPYLADCRFLDLFSGSGAIGIEALSRGAGDVVMVEQSPESLACIKENLKTTRLTEEARLLSMDVFRALSVLEAEKKAFDIIFMDPPYDNELERRVLTQLADSCLVNEDTLIVVEASLQTNFTYVNELGFEVFREKKYKNNQHVFIQTQEQEPA